MPKTPSDPPQATQTERAHAALKRAIVRGDIHEGTFLSESEIMGRFGVGRTPFREACNRLSQEGLLEVAPRRGYLVPRLTFHGVREGFELRLILEGAAAELAAVRATEEDIHELERLAKRPAARDRAASVERIVEANRKFHLRLAKTTRNSEIVRLLESVLERAERVMYVEMRFAPFEAEQFELLHEPIVEALSRRDPAAARAAVLRDIEQAQSATLGRSVLGATPQADAEKKP